LPTAADNTCHCGTLQQQPLLQQPRQQLLNASITALSCGRDTKINAYRALRQQNGGCDDGSHHPDSGSSSSSGSGSGSGSGNDGGKQPTAQRIVHLYHMNCIRIAI
jgi:hypothetical protein